MNQAHRPARRRFTLLLYALGVLLLLALVSSPANRALGTEAPGDAEFDDRPLEEALSLPPWFKLSFLDLKDDLTNATKSGKRGLIVYFHQKYCPYCKAHQQNNWGRKDIVTYTRKYFDVVALDTQNQRPVTDMDGSVYTEKQFAAKYKTNFTPSLLFYDLQGEIVLRLSGYHPPYQFRAALEYVADGHYRKESFRDYLGRSRGAFAAGGEELNENKTFMHPPYALDRSRFPAQAPLVVFFEQRRCHPCDVLHAGPLSEKAILDRLRRMEVVQLDMNANTPLITPGGARLNAKRWAEQLGLYYAPTLIFFDERGKEIMRVDSVIWFYRLRGVLDYILSGGYRRYPTFQLWRQRQTPPASTGR